MNHYLIIGIVAGLCTALLNLSGYAGGVLGIGFVLVLVSPLPLMIASFGWGSFVGLTAAITSGLVLALLITPLAGLLFFLLNTLPAWWLTHLLGLKRVDETTGADEWYPLSRLLIWLAGIATLATMAMFVPFGFSLESYRDAISSLMQQVYDAQSFGAENGMGFTLDDLVAIVSRLAPTASAMMLVVSTSINLFLAAKIAQLSGHLSRPWPDLHQLTMQPLGAYLFLVSLIGTFLLGGLAGIFAQIIASSLGSVLLLVGLSVLHFMTKKTPARLALLWTTYFLLVVFQWIGFFLVALGTAEVLINVRSRVSKGPPGPPNTENGAS